MEKFYNCDDCTRTGTECHDKDVHFTDTGNFCAISQEIVIHFLPLINTKNAWFTYKEKRRKKNQISA